MTSAMAKQLITVAATLGLLLCLGTASAKTTDKGDLPQALTKAVDAGQIEVKKTFSTDVPGLTGYLVESGGDYQIVYGDHGYLIMGHVISPEGKSLTEKYADEYIPKPDVAQVVNQLKKTGHLVQQGPDDAPVIYAFADPNCIFCHTLYERAKPLVKDGKLQIKWAMVGFLKSSSMGRAAAILSADNPTQALIKNEEGFDKESENGAIKPLDKPAGDIKKAIEAHAKSMAAAGGSGTPTLLYRENGHWAAKVGAPSKDWLKKYAENHK